MRGIILILILLIVAAIAAVATGFIDISQTRQATLPNVATTGNGVVAQGGQTPEFQVNTGKIEVGTGQRTVPVPEIRIAPGGNGAQPAQPAQNGAAAAPQDGAATTNATN